MIENIIFNLSSFLDSLAHTINQIYQAGIDFKRVDMDHKDNPNEPIHKDCLRCHIKQINAELLKYLNSQRSQRNKFTSHWYYDFSEYRN
jgi:hypothetical protein